MSLFDLTGKVAIVTGSSRGIGKASAEALADQGAKVVISSRNQDACEEVAAAINAKHGDGTAVAIAASISHKDALQHLVDETRRVFGRIDILVCNAASNPYYGPLAGIADDQFRKILDNNVLSNHWLIQMVAPEMCARKDGAIVIISSIGGLRGSPVIGAYNVSKAADFQLARNYAVEYGPDNVRVNCIAPGLIKTDFARALWENPEAEARVNKQTPLRRLGEPEDIAGGVVFLASAAGRYTTGQALVIDGGVTILMARFTDKSIIVTGAGSGIGRAAAILFAAEGGRVIVADKTEGAEETVALIVAAGGTAKAIRMDAGSEADVIATVALAVAEYGGLDILFANAGISGGMANLFDTTPELMADVLRVNLIGPLLAIKHGAPKIAERGKGAIVLTASVAGIRSGAGSPAYSASKAGVINLAAVAAQQLSGSNIRVNALCPGLTETGMTKPTFDYAREAGKMDRVGRLNPLRRGAQPEELARAALFLASDDASYVNGQALAVDGGLSSSHPVTRQEFGKTAV